MPKAMDADSHTRARRPDRAEPFLGRRIHLIGIGGSGMRALAAMLLDRGAEVAGSDMSSGSAIDRLIRQGADVHVGQSADNLRDDCELVVYSAAVHEDNPELQAARRRGLEVLKYSQMLGRLMARKIGIAIAGTHGKSTTTAMVAWALRQAGADPSFIIGAGVDQLGGPSGVGGGEHFVAEACEFDRSFLNLCPHDAAILNIEEDHLDCYRDLGAIIEAFGVFAARIPAGGVLVANGEDESVAKAARSAVCPVETFGLAEGCTWRGVNVTADRGRVSMDVQHGGADFGRVGLGLPGRHNGYNALAATALLWHAGLRADQIAAALAAFAGADRRMSLKGRARGVTVVDDYAHHPTEIKASLGAIREHYQPRRLWCVFQPHQHSRTRFLLKDFAQSFQSADEVIVPDIYFVRDSEREKDCISAEDLVSQIGFNGGSARYVESFGGIVRHLQRSLVEGDLVVTMGAGNIWEVADDLVRWLGTDR